MPGAATALTAGHVLRHKIFPALAVSSSPGSSSLLQLLQQQQHWATWHAAALVFYGIRLCTFLFVRQQTSRRIKDMQKRIEERAESSGSRLSRAPFVLSCAFLYYGLCAPLYLTSQVMAAGSSLSLGKSLEWLFKGLVATTWVGFLTAALGDLTKSLVKARKGEDHLVTSGIFAILRHPNYTGEMIGWTSSGLAGLVAFVTLGQFSQVQSWFYLASTLIGVMGINFVLLLATRNLEKKQAEKYGSQEAYKCWISKSWAGFALPDKPNESHSLEVKDEPEEKGSGI